MPHGARLPARVQRYIEALVDTSAQARTALLSVVLFGSAAKGGFSGGVSDVDLIIVRENTLPGEDSRYSSTPYSLAVSSMR